VGLERATTSGMTPISLYSHRTGGILHDSPTGWQRVLGVTWNDLFTASDAYALVSGASREPAAAPGPGDVAAPIGDQEVWASGVTYLRSRDARMEESESSGGDRFYDMVYAADRPELFFKATAPRVRGPGDGVRIREDSTWNVPEPEFTLAINSGGKIIGATIGNDMSSRSIEGENPLYLPQAKVYKGSCALGPCLVLGHPLALETGIRIAISRAGQQVFAGETAINRMKRTLPELADWLYRENEFPYGAYLMTGTGVVPGSDFTLASGDVVTVEIDGIGTLTNAVE
jgi:2-dehydro-3-deoxy-D-arabinonate dehydratase